MRGEEGGHSQIIEGAGESMKSKFQPLNRREQDDVTPEPKPQISLKGMKPKLFDELLLECALNNFREGRASALADVLKIISKERWLWDDDKNLFKSDKYGLSFIKSHNETIKELKQAIKELK